MKLLNNVKGTLNSTKNSFKRFPSAMAFSILTALFFIIHENICQKNGYTKSADDPYQKYAFLFLIATVIFLDIKIFLEGLKMTLKDKEGLKKYKFVKVGLYILIIPILYSVKDNMLPSDEMIFQYSNGYKYFGLLLFLIVALFYAGRIFYHKEYQFYVIKIIESILIAVLYSGCMFLGLIAIYSAITHLFGIPIKAIVYISTGLIIFIPFMLGIFLSNFPKIETSFVNYEVSNVLKILMRYILMPIFSIHIIIIYIYFTKIIYLGELPKNILVNLIVWFMILSILYLFACNLVIDIKSIRDFRKIFPIAMIPIIILMFYSIGIRVKEYGITENRYLIIASGIWGLIIMLYYIFYESKSNIAVPMILSLVVIIVSIGPLSAYNFTIRSQNNRFEKILVKNNMLSGKKIIPNGDIPKEDKIKIADIISYMNSSHRRYEMKYIPVDADLSDDETIKELFGFDFIKENGDNYLSYNYDFKSSINIENYSKLIFMNSFGEYDNKEFGNYQVKSNENNIEIYLIDGKNETEIISIDTIDLKNKLNVLKKSNEIIDPENLAITGKTDEFSYKIIFTSIYFYGDSDNSCDCDCEFYLLTDRK